MELVVNGLKLGVGKESDHYAAGCSEYGFCADHRKGERSQERRVATILEPGAHSWASADAGTLREDADDAEARRQLIVVAEVVDCGGAETEAVQKCRGAVPLQPAASLRKGHLRARHKPKGKTTVARRTAQIADMTKVEFQSERSYERCAIRPVVRTIPMPLRSTVGASLRKVIRVSSTSTSAYAESLGVRRLRFDLGSSIPLLDLSIGPGEGG